jgi:hypothetical protein
MAYCDDWFPLSYTFNGISDRLDVAIGYLPRAGVGFHPQKTHFLLFNPGSCPRRDRKRVYSSNVTSPPLSLLRKDTAMVVGHLFDENLTDFPHVARVAATARKAVQLLASAGLGATGAAPMVVRVFAYAAVTTASLLFGAAAYVKGRPDVLKALNTSWASGLTTLMGVNTMEWYAARDLAWELGAIPPADEIVLDAFSMLGRIIQRPGDSLVKRHITSRSRGRFGSPWMRWLSSLPMFPRLSPLIQTTSKRKWKTAVSKEMAKVAVRAQDEFRYTYTGKDECGRADPAGGISFYALRNML